MPHRFLISVDSQALFITAVTKNRLPVFKTDKMKNLLCRAIDEARASAGFLIFAYVVMIDHMHLVTDRPTTTSNVLRVLKGLTARRVIDYLKEHNYLSSLSKLEHHERERKHKYSLWQTEKNVFPVFREEVFIQKVNYIHQNPVRAGLVTRAIDYRWSSARIWLGCPSDDEPLLIDKDLIHWRQTRRRK
jgi:REP element-mobilizing transposase RayT